MISASVATDATGHPPKPPVSSWSKRHAAHKTDDRCASIAFMGADLQIGHDPIRVIHSDPASTAVHWWIPCQHRSNLSWLEICRWPFLASVNGPSFQGYPSTTRSICIGSHTHGSMNPNPRHTPSSQQKRRPRGAARPVPSNYVGHLHPCLQCTGIPLSSLGYHDALCAP
jgi:hypothetical protein